MDGELFISAQLLGHHCMDLDLDIYIAGANGYKRDGTGRVQKLFLYKASTSTSVFHVY